MIEIDNIYRFTIRTTDRQIFKFTYVNKGAFSKLGYSMKQMTGMTPLDVIADYEILSVKKKVEPLKKGEKEKVVFETVHKRANSSYYPVEVHLHRVQDGARTFNIAY
ncbi:MAG: PAS domain S-box protein [Balneolaceae bacterium]